MFDFPLQQFEEAGGVGSVHLGVMELEGDGKECLKPWSMVASPDEEWIVEDSTVHPYRSIYLIPGQRRCADHHAFCYVMIAAAFGYLSCKAEI